MESPNKVVYNITVRLVMIALVIAFMVVGKSILLPLAIAILFTFLLLPVSMKLEKWGLHRGISIVLSLIMAVIVVAGLMYFFYTQVAMFASDWPELSKQMTGKIDQLYQFINEKFNYSRTEQKNFFNERLTSIGESASQYIMSVFTATGSFIASAAIIPIFIFFLTYYRDKFRHFVKLAFKDDHKSDHAIDILRKISVVSQKYIKGLFIVVIILAVLNSAGFLILGLKHAILFGVLLAFLNIIPYIGVMVGSILPIAMALITEDQIGIAIGVAGVAVFVQFLENNFITPNVVGSSVSINPFTAILALLVTALIWGVPGMIIALPFTGMMKVAFDNVEQLKPYGFLMGEEKTFSPDNKHAKRKFNLRSKIKKSDNNNNN